MRFFLGVLWVFCGFWVVSARAETWQVGAYKGKYADTEFGKRFLREMPALRRKAFDQIARRLGISCEDRGMIFLELRDAEGLDEKELKKWDRRAAVARRRAGEPQQIIVTLYLEPIASGEAVPESVLAQAVAEAIFLERYDDKRLKDLYPDWVLDGLSAYAGGIAEAQEAAASLLAARRKAPEALLVDLESRKEDASLAQSFWAFLYLEKKCGAKGMAQFAQALYDGKPHDQELMALTNLAWGPLMAEMDAFARKQLGGLCAGGTEFKDLARRVREAAESDRGKFAAELSKLLSAYPNAYWNQKARYLLGQCLQEGGRRQDAARMFTDLFAMKPPRGEYVGDARYRLAKLLAEQGQKAQAREQFEAVVRDHFDEQFSLYAMWELAQLAAERRDEAGETRWLAAMVEKFPKHKFTDRARDLLERKTKKK